MLTPTAFDFAAAASEILSAHGQVSPAALRALSDSPYATLLTVTVQTRGPEGEPSYRVPIEEAVDVISCTEAAGDYIRAVWVSREGLRMLSAMVAQLA